MLKEPKAQLVFHSVATPEQFEVFLAKFFRTYQPFKVNGTPKQQAHVKNIEIILNGFASRLGIKSPEAVVWGEDTNTADVKKFRNSNEAQKAIYDFYLWYKSKKHWNNGDEKEVEKISAILHQEVMKF